MKFNVLSLLLSIVLIFSGSQCRKHKDPPPVQLPPITQEGKNTIGFSLNDEVWVPYYKCCSSCDPCGEISVDYGLPNAAPNALDFQVSRQRTGKSSTLTVSPAIGATVTSTGDKVDSILVSYRDENSNGNNGIYYGPLPGSKFLITKIDFQNQVISGEFELILLEQNGSGHTITLKDGRFDFKFNACRCSN